MLLPLVVFVSPLIKMKKFSDMVVIIFYSKNIYKNTVFLFFRWQKKPNNLISLLYCKETIFDLKNSWQFLHQDSQGNVQSRNSLFFLVILK